MPLYTAYLGYMQTFNDGYMHCPLTVQSLREERVSDVAPQYLHLAVVAGLAARTLDGTTYMQLFRP